MYFTNLCSLEIARVVQGDLNQVVHWMESSRLILNQNKTKSMLFGGWQNLAKSPKFVYCYSYLFSYLDFVLDENLSWKDHIKYVGSKVSRRLRLLYHIQSCLTLEASNQVYTSLLQLLFDYADVAWGGGGSQRVVAESYTTYRTMQLELYYEKTPQTTL